MRMKALKSFTLAILLGAMILASFWQGFGAGQGANSLAPSTVAIAQSERASVYELTDAEIDALVRRAVEMAGGLGAVVHKGDTVVIKPNLVEMAHSIKGKHPLPELLGGVATDRRVVRTVAALAHEAGAARIYVMEGSAVPTVETFRHYGYTKENLPFVDAIVPLETESGGWQEYDSPKLAKVELPDGRYETTYYLNRRYYEADAVISVPTMKNHWDAAVTGAVKNLAIGGTPANIYSGSAGVNLRWPKIPHGNEEYHGFMRDFYKCKPARFAVMDGLVGIQRGPTPNSDRGSTDYDENCMNMRCILASADPVALDVVESLVMSWDPASVKYLQYLGADGLGNTDPANIHVVGKKVTDVRKPFAGAYPSGGGRMFTDTTPPKVKVVKAKAEKGLYLLNLKADKDTARVEIYLDGKLAGFFKEGYDKLSVDISGLSPGKHQVGIVAYDRYLNDTVLPDLVLEKK